MTNKKWIIAEADYSDEDIAYQMRTPSFIMGKIKGTLPNVIYEVLYRDAKRGIYIGGEKICCDKIAAYREIDND